MQTGVSFWHITILNEGLQNCRVWWAPRAYEQGGFLTGLICCGTGSQRLLSNPKVRFFYDRKLYRGSILTLIYILTMMIINSFYCFKIIFYYWIVLLFLANSAYVVAIKIKSVLRKSASTNISPTYTVNIISELLNDYQFLVLVLTCMKLTL